MISNLTLFAGEISALTAALLWAVASIYYADIGQRIGALNLNLLKGIAAILLMSLTLLAGSLFEISSISFETVRAISTKGWLLLFVSGLIGIAIGDTAYFACLKRVGPQKGLMLESTSPLIAAVLALLLYAEYLSLLSWSGITVTTLGVVLVVRYSIGSSQYHTSLTGVLFGLLAATGQAGGIVLSRMALDGQNIEPLAGGLIRLSAGVLFLTCWFWLRKSIGAGRNTSGNTMSLCQAIHALRDRGVFINLVIAVFIGTYLAIWLQQLAVKFTNAGSAQALLGTCPLFGILIAVKQGYCQPKAVWFGLALGIFGILLLFQ
ncbi:EamA family transporter [Desulfosediminicola sp.]|uniref:EamA family transporter n=1 Tax=Desulfosediminicola sp. TaxID=2886825 RepID=UPI003AF31059